MRIASATIRNFRSIAEMTVELDDYTVLVGANGAGKSTVLYALQWFFDGSPLDNEDVHRRPGENLDDDLDVSVSVTFEDLTSCDRQRLGKYGRGRTATFRRTRLEDGKSKVVGNSRQGPGFITVREGKTVAEVRPAYATLRDRIPKLPDLGASPKKNECVDALTAWEDNPANAGNLVDVADEDASHLFGATGTSRLSDCTRMVFVPAALDIAGEVGVAGRRTALGELIGALTATAEKNATGQWREKHADALAELQSSVRENVEYATTLHEQRINRRLATLVPGARVTFASEVPDPVPAPTPTIRTHVQVDGSTNDVSRQGHGVQRAVMMAMMEALVPDEEVARHDHCMQDGETPEEAEARLAAMVDGIPSLVICIEEPEIYQHPVRARSFARVLSRLAGKPNVQVVIVTHSPYFARPEQFASLRRICLEDGHTRQRRTTCASIADDTGTKEQDVRAVVERVLPSTFSEAFFSECVVLVEGDTDRAVLEMLADRMDRPFDSTGVSVMQVGGKTSFRVTSAILAALGVTTHVVVDGDADGYKRKPAEKQANAFTSAKAQTERILGWLPGADAAGAAFAATTVSTKDFTLWRDDIESELETWTSFVDALHRAGGELRKKRMADYKHAAEDADLEDLPPTLRHCLDQILTLADHSTALT
ncbi:AAA family ATPase [Kineococcus sp. NPDC059986]|uniref:ATP-dependent nuclease n=1 Tax=Kineococcus sp. NPDC059986 TaxID=3155538 RepID=UPI00344BAF51